MSASIADEGILAIIDSQTGRPWLYDSVVLDQVERVGIMETAILTAVIAGGVALGAAVLAAWLSRRLKISEFRQAWINDLRLDVADYLQKTQKWFKEYGESKEDFKLFSQGNDASVILYRIKMRLNPNERKHEEFIATLEKIRTPYSLPKEMAEHHWATAAEDILEKARVLLKREWEVTKRMGMFGR